jgi:FixJ family two-component response regulator
LSPPTFTIAEQLYIGTRTVEAHGQQLSNPKKHSVAELIKYAIRAGPTSL